MWNWLKRQNQAPVVELKEMDEPKGKRLVLREYQHTYDTWMRASDALDSKLGRLLGSTSLILSVVTTLQLTLGVQAIGWLYAIGLGFAFVLYIILLIVILFGLRPQMIFGTISDDWNKVTEHFFDGTEEEVIESLIVTYIDNIKAIGKGNVYKANMLRVAEFLLVVIVIVLIGLGVFGIGETTAWPWQDPVATPIPMP